MTGSLAGAWGVAVRWALAALLLLHRPLGRLLRLAVRSSVGLAALALLNQIGLGLGVNLVNALIPGCAGCPWPGPAPDAPVGPADLRARSLCEIIPWTHLISSCRLCSLSCRGGIFPTFFPFSPRILRLFSPYPAFENYFPKNAGFFIPKGLFGDGRGH